MIDLTPLDVRNKAGDFKKAMRGYDASEVDGFLQLVSERFEQLVKENMMLKERSERLQDQVQAYEGRESAVREALVMAQKLREDITLQVEREVQVAKQGAEMDIRQSMNEAKLRLGVLGQALTDMERRRLRFLKAFRSMLQRELEAVEVEEARPPLHDAPFELQLGGRSPREADKDLEPAPAALSLEPPVPEKVAESSAVETSEVEERSEVRPDPGEGLWLSPLLKENRSGE